MTMMVGSIDQRNSETRSSASSLLSAQIGGEMSISYPLPGYLSRALLASSFDR